MQKLWFLCSARHLMLTDTYNKFCEDSLNGFQVIEQTWFCDWQSSMGNNSKRINAQVMVLRSARRLMLIDIYMKFREDTCSLNSF